MSLTTYHKKRNFKETAEPKGGKSTKGKHIFVIQRHHASRIHYDFRLEVAGVLKSWAVPKGPSLNPADKRLAMQVEDHPYDYKDFEGEIPKGNYGAGTVYIWDKGSFDLLRADGKDFDKTALKEIKEGDLKIRMYGKKLKGEFALVKMKNREDNSWLLLKHKDGYAVKEEYNSEDLTPKRVIEKGLKFKEAEKGSSPSTTRKSATTAKRATSKRAAEPEAAAKKKVPSSAKLKAAPARRYKPTMATLVDAPFSREGWLFEPKWDGYRAIADVRKGKVDLYSRNHISFNKDYPTIVNAVEKISHSVVLDGEVIVLNNKGISDFQALQNYKTTGKGKCVYMVFDLLYLNGRELLDMPLTERKELLQEVVKQLDDPVVIYSAHVMKDGEKLYKKAASKIWEGIIAKKADSVYEENRRTMNWLKMKVLAQQETIICGYTEPRGSRKKLGALILGVMDDKEQLRYVGHCGGGLTGDMIDMLYAKLQPLRRDTPVFKEKIKTNTPVTWVKPALVCEVKFSSWTEGGIMRQPILLGLREDKPVQEVHQETAKSLHMAKTAKTATAKTTKTGKTTKATKATSATAAPMEKERTMKLNGKEVTLTNQQKIFWPKENITKGQLIDYYLSVAQYLLPYLKDRPLSLHRFPNGITGSSFYHKDLDTDTTPAWIRTIPLHAASTGKDVDYMICNNEATLAYMINLGCIEANPWLSRTANLDNPDYLVMDLDPEDIAFKYVVETALCIKDVLEQLNINGFCKTSGASGLHIYIPTGGKYTFDTCRLFGEYIARQTNQQLPRTTSIIRAKAQRKKKVYIDFLQNSRGQTVAAPYAVRPKPGATVSTPLLWEEVNEKLNIADYNIFNTLERIQEKGDLWQPVQKEKNDLKKVIRQIEELAKADVE
ncbi:DNA ligase D [Chitinophaga agrisoli]|uniref:DNA ligase (ATP) n=1 Tax=Chitinophaga agrisoli TaxID=2607653 RepID=A0A5B2W3D1_9BACT|nr:DNA ligase D [Chitinophaga agrisoli]KAA2245250.1 DNA ligase D [Chitinophaga agrisoli]